MQKQQRHSSPQIRFTTNNGPDGGGGGAFPPVRVGGGACQGTAPQGGPPGQDKGPSLPTLHQGTGHLAHSLQFGAHRPNVPTAASAQAYFHQIRAQQRPHSITPQNRPLIVQAPYYDGQNIQSNMYQTLYATQGPMINPLPMYTQLASVPPPPESGSGRTSGGAVSLVQAGTNQYQTWPTTPQVIMTHHTPQQPNNSFNNFFLPRVPYSSSSSNPPMSQPQTPQQPPVMQQAVGSGVGAAGGSQPPMMPGSSTASNTTQQSKMKKRNRAIPIIDPTTGMQISTDDSKLEHSLDPSQRTALQDGASQEGQGRMAAEFAQKVALVAVETSVRDEEDKVSLLPTVINGPDQEPKQLPTPVVSAKALAATYDVPIHRNASRTSDRSSDGTGRGSKVSAVPPLSAVKTQPPPNLAPVQPPPVVPSPPPPPPPVQEPLPPPAPVQQVELITPPIQSVVQQQPPPFTSKPQRKPREEKKPAPPPPPPPTIVQVEEKPVAPSAPVEEPIETPEAPQTEPTPPPPVPTPPPPVPVITVPTLLSKSSNFADMLDIKQTIKAAQSALAASQPLVEEKTPQPEPQPEQPTGKALQRPKTKKTHKSREMNQKGVEKEGTDMDAFMDTTARAEDKREPSPVCKPEPQPTPEPAVDPPPPAPQPPLETNSEQEEEEQSGEEPEIDMVTVKNEENTLLSLEDPEKEVIKTQVINRSPAIQLKHEYKDDQWSPLNPEGKKVYDREFLLRLREEPLSSKKPDNIISDLEIFVKDKEFNTNNNSIRRGVYNNFSMGRGNGFVPEFIRSSSSQSRMVSKRSSQSRAGGGSSQRGSKGMYNNSLSLRDDFKLNQVENAWKPSKMTKQMDTKTREELETEEVYKRVRGILNKLTPQKFDTLVGQFMSLPISNINRMKGVIKLVFEKAVDEPAFSNAYAELCRTLAKIEVLPSEESETGDTPAVAQPVNFRKILITRCQTEFEANKKAEMDFEKKQQEINETKDADKRKELQLIFNEEERKIRMKSVGLVRFIGELYKLKMLTSNIMHGCIRQLLDKIDEESLECLCKLLSTIGKELEVSCQAASSSAEGAKHYHDWNDYFIRMGKLSKKHDGSKVSSRVRFMLQDVIELRENKWVPRRDENKPKTMAQIQEEVEKESEKAAMLAATPRKHQDLDRAQRDRRNNHRSNNQSEDGWTSVSSNKNSSYINRMYCPEASKIMAIRSSAATDLNSTSRDVNLGPSHMNKWGTGASTKSSFTDNNSFAALTSDERKPPSNIGARMKPCPSTEKERAIHAVKQMSMDSSRSESSRLSSKGRGPGGPQSSPSPSLSSAPAAPQPRKQEQQKVEAKPAPPPSPPSPDMQDKILKSIDSIMGEYMMNNNVQEGIESTKDLVRGKNVGSIFVNCTINYILEKTKAHQRFKTSELLGELIKAQVFSVDIFVDEMSKVFECADDLMIDLPYIWQYLGEILGVITTLEVINFGHYKPMVKLLQNIDLAVTLTEVFQILIKEKGPVFIKEQWEANNIKQTNLIPENKIQGFLNDFPFLEGSKVKVGDSNISIDRIYEKLFEFLKLLKGTEGKQDHLFDWVTTNVGSRVNDPLFIGALTKAVINASLGSNELDKALLHEYMVYMKRYVDNKEELELRCLYTVQNLVVKQLECPPGMLVDIFKELYDSTVISSEGFHKWKSPERDEQFWEADGKGVAVATSQSFFKALQEDLGYEQDDDPS